MDELACACDAPGCSRPLESADCMLAYCTDAGERRAYECDCGAVTVTVHR